MAARHDQSPYINVDMKNAQDYDIPNVLACWIESNKPDAIKGMDNSDRRFLIVSVDRDGAHLQPLADEYYWKLYGRKGGPKDGLIDNPDLMGAIAYQLQTRDLSKYSGNRAPLTAAKKQMQANTDSPLKQWMVEHAGTSREPDILSERLLQIEDVIAVLKLYAEHIIRNYKGNLERDIAAVLQGAPFYAENLGQFKRGKHRVRLWYAHRIPGAKLIKDWATWAKDRAGSEPRLQRPDLEAPSRASIMARYISQTRLAADDPDVTGPGGTLRRKAKAEVLRTGRGEGRSWPRLSGRSLRG